ncbi:MAG: Mu transposase C-terminal domain-containing protein [Cyanobacteria bacterium J06641_2]
MATRPTNTKGKARIQPGQGIKINYIYYWSDSFRNSTLEKTDVPVRYDPFDMGIAYAYLEGRWVRCISQYYSTFVGHTEKEVSLAASEIRQSAKRNATKITLNAKRLADFMNNVQEHETLLLQRLRDLENKVVISNCIPDISVPKLKVQSSPNETTYPTVEEVNQTSRIQSAPLDVTQLPILEEYC